MRSIEQTIDLLEALAGASRPLRLVAEVLAEIAAGAPQGRARELAGPEPQDFVDMAPPHARPRGDPVRLIPSWYDGPFGPDMTGDVLLPGPDARIGASTFEEGLSPRTAPRVRLNSPRSAAFAGLRPQVRAGQR